MATLKVLDMVGAYCATYKEGGPVFRAIDKAFSRDDSVVLDLKGVLLTSSAFFNESIGQLYRDYDSAFLKDHLKIVNLTPRDSFVLARSLEAAKKHQYAL